MSELTQYHIQRWGDLKSKRGNFENQWEEAASLVIPAHRDSFTSRGMNNAFGAEGQKKTEKQFDSTAAMACQRFSAIIESLATPQASLWHRISPSDKTLKRNRAARVFFDDLNERLYDFRYRPSANFVGNSQQVYVALGAYGNGSLFVDQPEEGKGLRYRYAHLGEVWYAENHAGVIDTFYWARWLEARQIVQEYQRGGDNIPEAITEAMKNPNTVGKKFEVLQCVYPRRDYDPQRVDAKGMPFASLTILVQTQDLIRESGYNSFPLPTSRYSQAPGEVYGRGPAQWVLPAIKVANEEKKDILQSGHRALNPVLLAHDDGVLGTFSLKPGAANPGTMTKDGKRLVDVLPSGNIDIGFELLEMEKNDIKDAFLIPLFQILVDTPQMTATEVLERAREKGLLIAPTAGRIQAEFLGRLIEREIDLLAQQGLLPPLPSILQGEDIQYQIDYDSPMARMAKAERSAGFVRSVMQTAELVKLTQDPSLLDHYNFDAATPAVADLQGVPVDWMNSQDVVEQKRAARAEAAQAQQMVEAAPAMASVASTMAKQ